MNRPEPVGRQLTAQAVASTLMATRERDLPARAPASLVHLPSNKWVQQHAPLLQRLEVGQPLLTPKQRHAELELRGQEGAMLDQIGLHTALGLRQVREVAMSEDEMGFGL